MSWSQGSWEQAGKKGNIGRVGIKGETFLTFLTGRLKEMGKIAPPWEMRLLSLIASTSV